MLRLSACGSIFATALTDHEVCTIAMGRDWKKHDEAGTLVIQYSSERLSEYEVDAKIFRQFYLYVSHVDTPSGQGVELCRDVESSVKNPAKNDI